MGRDIEKDLIEIECAIKSQKEKDNIFTMSVLQRCYKLVSELKEYKDLEEQGGLLKSPCKIGDIVYDVVLCDDKEYHIFPMKVFNINLYGDIHKGKVYNVYLEDDYTKAYRSFYDFGKTVFICQKEAESALQKKQLNKKKPHHCEVCGMYIREDNLKVCNECAAQYKF